MWSKFPNECMFAAVNLISKKSAYGTGRQIQIKRLVTTMSDITKKIACNDCPAPKTKFF